MAEHPAQPVPRADDRRDRRRVGALLNQYYAIEGAEAPGRRGERPPAELASELDRQGFDARRYFDDVVASGQLPDLQRRTADLEAEVRDLDGRMQTLVYENYSKFIRATDVIRKMKVKIDGLGPDIRHLEGSISRATEHQDRAEAGVCDRAQKLDGLLQKQQVCRKLRVLFGLPDVLRRCLDQGAYARAVTAYCSCADVLRRHRDIPAFQNVLEQVELHISEVREALERRLRCQTLSVDEAVSSAITLMNLGEEQSKVAAGYVSGRVAMLQQSCTQCFEEDDPCPSESSCSVPEEKCRGDAGEIDDSCHAAASSSTKPSREQQERERPEAAAFCGVCARVATLHAPRLCEAAEGLRRLQEVSGSPASTREGSPEERAITDFVAKQLEELCEQVSRLVERHCPPTRVLVSCVQSLRESLQRLDALAPRLVPRLFAALAGRVAASATAALFARAAALLVSCLRRLHGECRRIPGADGPGLDCALEEIAAAEEAIIMCGFTALSGCQPLLGLLGPDRPALQQLVRGVQCQLLAFFLAFVEACHLYVGREREGHDPSLPVVPRLAGAELGQIGSWGWSGVFGLALVRIGRHLEVKAIGKVLDVARDLFTTRDFAAAELQPHPAVLKATRWAAQAVITHYALLAGQRLAAALGDAVRSVGAAPRRDPRDPCAAVAAALEEVHAVDGQLACILSDPRKAREASHQHRALSHLRNSMELEMERLWAKKLQAYAPIPFNRNGAILGVLRIGYKALYEFVREQTFTKSGLHQVQIDCDFLLEAARDFVEAEDAGVLESLLDEAVTSASQRCPEPELLEVSVVEALRDGRRQKAEG